MRVLAGNWRQHSPVARHCVELLARHRHGDLPRWLSVLARAPAIAPAASDFGPVVTVGAAHDLQSAERAQLDCALKGLLPWRKGPFRLHGIHIDAEWRSDLKWQRIAPHMNLAGARVLDVGSGNGYYGWRMLAAGAASVTGIDPSVLFVLQHALVAYYVGDSRNVVLPLTVDDLPPCGAFDVIFSMGVVYHRRDPESHVRALARRAHHDTVIVLESLVADELLRPPGRYAQMRNVHLVPDEDTLARWLAAAGYGHCRVVSRATTTVLEQRSTEWMPYQSLADALDPENPNRTVEGYPAPRRVVMMASR